MTAHRKDEHARSRQMLLKISEHDHALLKRAAAKKQISVSEFVRQSSVASAKRTLKR